MRAAITDQPIDANALLESMLHRGHGAALLFIGTVRDINDGRAVTGIRYDAYREMAEELLARIVAEAEQRAGQGCAVAAVHRIGELSVGEISVAIAVSTRHRAPAFEANRYIIEEIKKRLPIWKQEAYADGVAEWLSGAPPGTDVRVQ